jgi:hypothetical protein
VKFQVTYAKTYQYEIDASDLATAQRRMQAFRGTEKEGVIKLLSIVAMTKLPGLEEAVLNGKHKDGIDGMPT